MPWWASAGIHNISLPRNLLLFCFLAQMEVKLEYEEA